MRYAVVGGSKVARARSRAAAFRASRRASLAHDRVQVVRYAATPDSTWSEFRHRVYDDLVESGETRFRADALVAKHDEFLRAMWHMGKEPSEVSGDLWEATRTQKPVTPSERKNIEERRRMMQERNDRWVKEFVAKMYPEGR